MKNLSITESIGDKLVDHEVFVFLLWFPVGFMSHEYSLYVSLSILTYN